MVARLNGVQEVSGSNPDIPTIFFCFTKKLRFFTAFHSVLPDADPFVFRQIHAVSRLDVIGFIELLELLYRNVDPEIA